MCPWVAHGNTRLIHGFTFPFHIPHSTFQIYKSYIIWVEYVFQDMKHPLGARSNIQYCIQLLGAYCLSGIELGASLGAGARAWVRKKNNGEPETNLDL